MNIGLVIPTYNEADNLPGIVSALFALPLEISVLVVDDNSPDGTGKVAEQLATEYPGNMSVIHRRAKLGISSAYEQGFRCALAQDVDAVAQMDADFSHNPMALVEMARRVESCDVVFGSRYVRGGSVDARWSIWRKGLSAWGNFYARTILRVPVRDLTTGYRLWRADTLRGMPLDKIQSKGYVFQVEMAYLAHCLEYRMQEIPIHFEDRSSGKSKMSSQIQAEAAFRVWQIWLTHRHLCHIGRAARIRNELQTDLLN